jgi:hypothetical protein
MQFFNIRLLYRLWKFLQISFFFQNCLQNNYILQCQQIYWILCKIRSCFTFPKYNCHLCVFVCVKLNMQIPIALILYQKLSNFCKLKSQTLNPSRNSNIHILKEKNILRLQKKIFKHILNGQQDQKTFVVIYQDNL